MILLSLFTNSNHRHYSHVRGNIRPPPTCPCRSPCVEELKNATNPQSRTKIHRNSLRVSCSVFVIQDVVPPSQKIKTWGFKAPVKLGIIGNTPFTIFDQTYRELMRQTLPIPWFKVLIMSDFISFDMFHASASPKLALVHPIRNDSLMWLFLQASGLKMATDMIRNHILGETKVPGCNKRKRKSNTIVITGKTRYFLCDF